MSCLKCEDQLIDFIEGTLSPEEAEEFQQHLSECTNCQLVLEQQREIFMQLDQEIEKIEIPYDFMQQVEEGLKERPSKRRRKAFGWRIAAIAVALCILLFSTDLTTGMINGVLQWWQGISGSQQANGGDVIPGEKVNINVVDQNIRITITHVAADEFGTDIYYEIEDLNREGLYDLGLGRRAPRWVFQDVGENKNQLSFVSMKYFPSEEPYTFKGILNYEPIEGDQTNITINFNNLDKVHQPEEGSLYPFLNSERTIESDAIKGNWQFEIPVQKQEAKIYEIAQTAEVDGFPITIDVIKATPTRTVLQYSYIDREKSSRIGVEKLEVDGKYYYSASYGASGGWESNGRWKFQTNFEPLYLIDPEEIKIHFGTVEIQKESFEQFSIDLEKSFPHSFEYLGNTVTIDAIEIGNPTIIEVSSEERSDIDFDNLDIKFDIKTVEGRYLNQFQIGGDGYILDEQGNRYTIEQFYTKVFPRKARFISTKYRFQLSIDRQKQGIIPTHMQIGGYTLTKFIDDIVTIKLK